MQILKNRLTATLKNAAKESTQEPDQNADDDGQVDQIGLEGVEVCLLYTSDAADE